MNDVPSLLQHALLLLAIWVMLRVWFAVDRVILRVSAVVLFCVGQYAWALLAFVLLCVAESTHRALMAQRRNASRFRLYCAVRIADHFPRQASSPFPVISRPVPAISVPTASASNNRSPKPMSAAANDAHDTQDDDLLTDEDVVARYRGRITLGTLRNWRALKIGPPYIKVGKAVLYSRTSLQAWDKRNTVACSKLG